MRSPIALAGILLFSLNSCSQVIPTTETTFRIQKKEIKQFDFSLPKGYTLKAIVWQKGIDLSISVYKKGDTSRLAYFDSPNGEYGPEPVSFESPDGGNYIMVLEPIREDTAMAGNFIIRQIAIRYIYAKHDTSFAHGSEILIDNLNSVKIDNLSNLGTVWGFLKYYHPAIARGDYNWDASLFRIMPRILSATNKAEANAELEKWVDSIGKPAPCLNCQILKQDSSVKIMPDYGNLFESGNLTPTLVEKLNYIKINRNQEENYYVGQIDGIGNPDFEHENPYMEMVYPDAGYRLLALFRYWNIIQYFYPNKYIIGENWNKILPEFIPKFVGAENASEYTISCLEIIARIHDTHANISGNNQFIKNYFGKYAPPIQAKFIENKLIITRYYTDTLSIRENVKIGDLVTKINGQPVELLVKKYLSLTPGSNYETQLRDLPYVILRSPKDRLELELQRDDKIITRLVPCVESDKINIFLELDPNPNDSSYKLLNGNIGYLFPGRYHDRQLDKIKKTFENTLGLIIDMRTYPSEFMPFSFGTYIKPAPSPFVMFTIGDVHYPGVFRFTPPLRNGELNSAFYNGPIVEIVNTLTQSQAEYTTMAFQTAPDFTVIGSTTAGADGNVSPIHLPGGIVTYISGIGVYYPDGEETQRKGIRINIIVRPTIEGIKNGKDQLLDKAVEIINEKSADHIHK